MKVSDAVLRRDSELRRRIAGTMALPALVNICDLCTFKAEATLSVDEETHERAEAASRSRQSNLSCSLAMQITKERLSEPAQC